MTTLAVYILLTRAGRDAMRVGLTSLGSHPLRTSLALAGIVTGVAVVVAVISIGDGTRAMVLDEVAATGGTSIIEIVRDDWHRQGGTTITSRSRRRWSHNRAKPLDYRDYENLDMMLTQAVAVCGEGDSQGGLQVRHGDREKAAPVVGATTGYQQVYNWLIADGRLFSDQDVEGAAKVAVLGSRIATDLFGELSPVGGEIRLRRTFGGKQADIRLSVIGVMEARSSATGSDGWNDRVILPLTTFHKRVTGGTEVTRLRVRAADAGQVTDTLAEVKSVLARRHEDVDAFTYWTATEELATAERLGSTLKLLMGAVAGIALGVAAIGIMNIMLVSVAERVPEIGLRKALGAKRHDVLFQFLIETSVLSVGGGLLGAVAGIGLGSLAARGVAHFVQTGAPWPSVVSPSAIVVSVGIAFLVGIAAGVYPALRAARLAPIEALRSSR
jgi:putative ABC transport system permease protein